MIPVLAGTSLAFEYTAYDGSSTLSVAMKIYDVTTGFPSLVATTAMTHVINGTYVGYFNPTAEKQYLINKMVYTDNTFATVSTSYSPGSESIQASTEQTDITTANTNINTLVSRLTATRASNLDNLDVTVSSRASQASVDNIQNNTSFVGIVPVTLTIPATGSSPYIFYANLFDDTGGPTDPDSEIMQIEIKDTMGNIIVPVGMMTRDGLGTYQFTYYVNSTDPERTLTVIFTYTYLGVPYTQYRVTNVSLYDNDLQVLLSRLTAGRAANLDNLDTTISSRASQASIAAIQAIVNQLHFNGNNVLAETAINDDKTGYSLSSGFITTLVNAIWDELLANHVAIGTMGFNQNLLGTVSSSVIGLRADYTTARATKLDNLDINVGSRAAETDIATIETAISAVQTSVTGVNSKLGTPAGASVSADIAAIKTELDGVNAKTINLPSDPASQSATNTAIAAATGGISTIATQVTAIKAKTDNLPASPASAAAVAAIPTNPLLTTDTRLNTLDANISSRAAPSDLAPLASAAALTASTAAILSGISTIENDLTNLATAADVASAVAPLAQQTTLLEVQTTVDSFSGSTLTAADVWDYATRGLTVPVETTDDLGPLAKTTDVTAAQAAIIAAIPQFDCQMASAIDPALDTLTFQVWLEDASRVVISPQTAEVNVVNSVGAPIITGLTSTSPSSSGIFTLVYDHASEVFAANQAYTVSITITNGSNTYESTRSITVF